MWPVLLLAGCPANDSPEAPADASAKASTIADAAARAPSSSAAVARCPDGRVTRTDKDGDGISDRIEGNNKSLGHAALDPARCTPEDPSRAIGKPHRGTLAHGVNMPDRSQGVRHFLGSDAVDTDDWATLSMVQCLEVVGRGMAARGRELGVTDLSRKPGGRFRPHKSHQTGVDADLRYQRKDNKNWPLDLKRYPSKYDRAETIEMFRLFAARCPVDVVFVDLERIGFDEDEVPGMRFAHVRGHSNHWHLRLRAEVAP